VKVTVIGGRELTAGHRRLWSRLQRCDPEVASPFFCPELTLAAAAVRRDVHVGLVYQGAELVGFFPFQRGESSEGEAVAAGFSDFQGVVLAPGVEWTAAELIGGCGLSRWRFDHLVSGQRPFGRYHRERWESPYLDLSQGYEAYVRRRRRDGSRLFENLGRKRRKLEREVGPVRFAEHVGEPQTLRWLMRLKSEQYRRTGTWDRFGLPWVVALFERLQQIQHAHFGGLLSVLYAGDEMVAAHMGLRSHTSWHWWFPTYDPRFAKYSAGLILLLAMAERAAARGIGRIDLGRGESRYKRRLMSASVWVAGGCVTL